MLSSPYYAKNYAAIIDTSLICIPKSLIDNLSYCCLSTSRPSAKRGGKGVSYPWGLKKTMHKMKSFQFRPMHELKLSSQLESLIKT